MSLENVQTIVGRAILEPEYRTLLFSDPTKALEGYDLTEEETQALKSMDKGKVDLLANDLEERISKSGLFLQGKYSDASLNLNLAQLFRVR
jgi:hypothetical protein